MEFLGRPLTEEEAKHVRDGTMSEVDKDIVQAICDYFNNTMQSKKAGMEMIEALEKLRGERK